ncbi:unnamed protein product [Orchesella dallaii]|uniref:Ig-like domain-containing protein n=1 Tax=Orchesella dallaii TaxID=48710 RepID=A0ABP1RKM5_9HEXA
MSDVEFGKQTQQQHNSLHQQQPRPLSTTSSQLSFSDRMDADDGGGDADEDNSSLRSNPLNYNNPSSTCSSSLNLHRQGSNASQSKELTSITAANVVNGSAGSLMAKTTTISTIAMESNTSATSKCSPTRLVIALLQTPHQALQLKIIELSPNLLKLPDNLPEAEDYLKNHSQVIKNLQSKQSPVEELLRQADSLIATQKPRAEVYAAMADSLGQTWKDLNAILEERRIVLDLAFNCHKTIQSCVDKMNELHSDYSKFKYLPTIEIEVEQSIQTTSPQDVVTSIRKLKEDRADVLKRVSQALDTCQQLLNKITDFNLSIDSRQLFLKRDVDYATKQVHRWLERLHDRRMILEEKLKMKREQFEEMADFLVHDKEMSGLLDELERLRKASQEFSLGHSVQSAEEQRDALDKMVHDMKMLQERALLTARKLEHDQQKGKFYQRSGLKQKIYDILGTVNDLITDSIDFELSLVDAKEFFHLAETANAKLDELASCDAATRAVPKTQINSLTYDALSKGQILLDSLGWDSPRTKGVRTVYEELNKRKALLQDEMDHLELLDEYNNFLESVNQAYQNILNVETCILRTPKTLPVEPQAVAQFRQDHERTMETLSDKTNFQQILNKLDEIYPNLSEEEKMSTEEKVNQLKCLSNLVIETILLRIWLAGEWLKILELDANEWPSLASSLATDREPDRKRLAEVADNINRLYDPIQQQLNEVQRTDPDLITSKMEEKVEEIIKKYQNRQEQLVTFDKIREICHAYKVKLDHHLLGKPGRELEESGSRSGLQPDVKSTDELSSSEPCYFPVLDESTVATTLQSEEPTSAALECIIKEQLQAKLNSTLTTFFQPLITNFRQEILRAQENLAAPLAEKTQEEVNWERYFERLKESYVKVTKEIEGYLHHLKEVCRNIEDHLTRSAINSIKGSGESVAGIEKELNSLTELRSNFENNMDPEIKRRLENTLAVVGHEEPPIEAEKEERTLRTLSSKIVHDALGGCISEYQDVLTRQLTEKMIHSDLDMINHTLNELVSELEHPCNYGNNLADAQSYLASFERFEKTVETLRDKLSRLLTTAGMSETDVKAQNLLSKLNLLVDRKGKRRELILLSLEYFKLIEKSYEHYEQQNKEIDAIIAKSKQPEITIDDIEDLLSQLRKLKKKEAEQDSRLQEIQRIANIIFDLSQDEETQQHYPLRDRSARMGVEITRVESDLNDLLGVIRSQSASTSTTTVPSAIEQEIESQIILQQESTMTEKHTLERQSQFLEIERIEKPSRPTSQEMCTQTSLMDEEEMEAKTREYLKEKDRMTAEILETLRQTMSPLPPPPPQTVEKETQFEGFEEEVRTTEKVDRDTLTQTIKERLRSFETQTEEVVSKGVEISTETEEMEICLEPPPLAQRPASRDYQDPIFIQPLKDLIVNEGDKVVLECKTTGRIKKLIWLKDGLEIVNNPDYKTDFLDGSTARLSIDEALQEDSAIFTCRAYGEDENVMVETSGRLTIREPITSVLLPPQFLPHAPISVGEHGKSHFLQLKVEGNPLPTVQWFKDGQCIDTSPDYIITFNNGLCEIQFDELVKDMDDGFYTCVGMNKIGDCETRVALQIRGDVDISKKLSRQPPRITKPLPKNLMCRAGQKVKLECEFESHTDFNVVWIKDDNKILTKTNSSAEVTTQGSTSTLVFNEAYPINSGKYSVLIRNAGGECQSDSQIVVKGLLPAETSDSELNISDGEAVKPSVKMPLKDVRARVGESLRLDCVIVGNPEPEVIWYKNAIPLKESPNHHLLFHGDKCTLVIDSADLVDNGIYSVSAINNCGEAASKCQVFVYDKSPEALDTKPVEPPRFVKIIQDEMVTAGHEFSFVVELAPTPENPDVISEVTWWKNNSQIPPTERVTMSQDGPSYKLHFSEVDLSDKGNYMVKAVNSGGDAKCFGCLIVKENFEKAIPEPILVKEIEKPVQLQAVPPPSPPVQTPPAPRKMSLPKVISKPPRFVVPLEGKMVDDGDRNISLKCIIDASPPATVRWIKNNATEPLQSSPESNLKLSYNEKNGEAELLFAAVNVKDGGRYTCTASNEHGLASSVTDLIVKKTTFPPVFSKRLQSLTIDEGKRIYLEVDVYGKPPPEIKWELNGVPITAAGGIAMKSDTPTRHSLVISEGKPDRDAGEYKVTARNDAGEATSTCTVNIIEKPVIELPIQVIRLPQKTSPVPPPTEIQVKVSEPIIKKVEEKIVSSQAPIVSVRTEVQQPDKKGVHADKTSIVESTTTTIITSTEERLYESRVTRVLSPVPSIDIIPSVKSVQQQSITMPPPVVEIKLPVVETKPHVVETKIPVVERRLPVVETTIPVVETRLPIVETRLPIVETRLPIVETKIPVVEARLPVVEKRLPIVETRLPVVETKIPVVETRLPIVETKPPASTIDETLVPGPEPEILVAPLPVVWSKSKNQVLEKVKIFEEESSETREEAGPSGGVRIIPITKSTPSPSPQTQLFTLDFSEPPRVEPILPPVISPGPFEGYLMEPPKVYHDVTSSSSNQAYKIGDTYIQTQEHHSEQRSATYIKPSKFIPEKMRESDYESEVESSIIPAKWIPPTATPPPIAPTTSAFVPMTSSPFPASVIPQTTLGSMMPPPPLQVTTSFQQPQQRPVSEPVGVKTIAKLWPPPSPTFETTPMTFSTSSLKPTEPSSTLKSPTMTPVAGSRLSPLVTQERARSPTPNKEAIDMDKLWSRPIRFASPIPQVSIPSPSYQQPAPSPSTLTPKRKPEVPPKPASSWLKRTTPTPYSPVVSPLPPSPGGAMKPEVPPKPSYIKAMSPYSPMPSPLPSSRPVSASPGEGLSAAARDHFYYVSTVSTPRTTPIPPQITGWTSPIATTPEVPPEHQQRSTFSSFHEKREHFESTTSSYSTFEESSSSQKQFSSSSKHFSDVHPSGVSLLDQSFLPPPGEPPVFMYAPPPTKPTKSTTMTSPQIRPSTSTQQSSVPNVSQSSSSKVSSTSSSYQFSSSSSQPQTNFPSSFQKFQAPK